jgi:hypothetical protein
MRTRSQVNAALGLGPQAHWRCEGWGFLLAYRPRKGLSASVDQTGMLRSGKIGAPSAGHLASTGTQLE